VAAVARRSAASARVAAVAAVVTLAPARPAWADETPAAPAPAAPAAPAPAAPAPAAPATAAPAPAPVPDAAPVPAAPAPAPPPADPSPDTAAPEAPPPPPRWHAWFGVGGALPLPLDLEPGLVLVGGVSKGRFGARLESFVFGTDASQGLVAGFLTYEGGRTYRRVVIDLRAGAGVAWPSGSPVLAAGIGSRWGVLAHGLVVIGAEAGVYAEVDELPLPVHLVLLTTLGLSF
jgi:hypothetical protein